MMAIGCRTFMNTLEFCERDLRASLSDLNVSPYRTLPALQGPDPGSMSASMSSYAPPLQIITAGAQGMNSTHPSSSSAFPINVPETH